MLKRLCLRILTANTFRGKLNTFFLQIDIKRKLPLNSFPPPQNRPLGGGIELCLKTLLVPMYFCLHNFQADLVENLPSEVPIHTNILIHARDHLFLLKILSWDREAACWGHQEWRDWGASLTDRAWRRGGGSANSHNLPWGSHKSFQKLLFPNQRSRIWESPISFKLISLFQVEEQVWVLWQSSSCLFFTYLAFINWAQRDFELLNFHLSLILKAWITSCMLGTKFRISPEKVCK